VTPVLVLAAPLLVALVAVTVAVVPPAVAVEVLVVLVLPEPALEPGVAGSLLLQASQHREIRDSE